MFSQELPRNVADRGFMLGTCRLPEPSGRVSAGRAYRLLARETGTGSLVAGLPTDELNEDLV